MGLFGKKPAKYVLFACIENAGRSQMAEGFFRKYAPKGWTAMSGGSSPKSYVNPLAMEVMKEIGVDISSHKSKILSEDKIRGAELKVNMGCMDTTECPTLILGNYVDWGIEDPKDKPIEKVRKIRDEIEIRVKELVKELK
ncbi:arsenate reductase ArsC [Candidatus Nitrosotalea bavarica]|uniref:arsenate reductase ArsC n=1 Tax=Candidatus Nitrosotalea bavarica TaxID=1903277 RepID=UPI000C704D7C|nr:arsenate reductase ArsC [Candidatus Nitrosotalea bavarica]